MGYTAYSLEMESQPHSHLLPRSNYISVNTMMSHERHEVSIHGQFYCKLESFFHANNKGNQNSATIIFVIGIQWWVPVTKDEKCGKCFHMRTTSCSEVTTASTAISYPYQDQIRLQLRVLSILSSSFTPSLMFLSRRPPSQLYLYN